VEAVGNQAKAVGQKAVAEFHATERLNIILAVFTHYYLMHMAYKIGAEEPKYTPGVGVRQNLLEGFSEEVQQ